MAVNLLRTASGRIYENRLWPSRGMILILLCLSLLVCRTTSQFGNYMNIRFAIEPQDLYVTTDRTASFDCVAKGTLISSGKNTTLDVAILRNGETLPFFPPERHDYYIDNSQRVIGVYISPVLLQDDGVTYQCQALVDGTPVAVFSRVAVLTVSDGRPPEIPITEISKGLYHVSVEWDNVLVPLGGELQGYKTYVYDTSNSLVYSITVDDGSITEYTFSGLEPDTQYRFSVVGFNMFGDGNVSNVLQVKTLTPLVPNTPQSLVISSLPNTGDVQVEWMAPDINYQTMTPIIHYKLVYYPVDNPSGDVVTPTNDNTTLYLSLSGLVQGNTYRFSLTAVNSAGDSIPTTQDHVTLLSTETTTMATVVSTTSLTSSQTMTSFTTSSVTPTSSHTVATSETTTTTSLITSTTSYTSQVVVTSSQISTATQIDTFTSSTTEITPSTHTTVESSTPSSFIISASSSFSSSTKVKQISTTSTSVSTTNTRPSSSLVNQQSDGSSSTAPNLVILVIGGVAGVIFIAIIVVSIILVVVYFCFPKSRGGMDMTDHGVVRSQWPHKPPTSVKRWSSKESSIKGSSISGSVSHSLSSDMELPPLPINSHIYTNVPSHSPSSKNSDELANIEEMIPQTEIHAEINDSGTPV